MDDEGRAVKTNHRRLDLRPLTAWPHSQCTSDKGRKFMLFFAVTLTMSRLSLYWLQCRAVSKHNPGCSREYMYTCCQSTWWERFKNLLKGRNQVSVKGSLHSEEPGARTCMRIPRCKRTETPTQTVSLHHRQVTQSSHLRQITTFCGVSATLHPRSVEAANHWLITETGEEQKIT